MKLKETDEIEREPTSLVSVLMTAYNREKYIAEAIESVLASTYTNFELIIVDDCSTDNTVQIARRYEAKDERVKVYVNEKNLGDYPNRNKAASYAKGEYIMFVDSDDRIFKESLAQLLTAMAKFEISDFGMYFSRSKGAPFQYGSEEAVKKHFFVQPFLMIGPGGTVIKKSFFTELGGYPTKYGPANDMYFNLKAASQTKIVLLPFDFVFYRIHDEQQLGNKFSYLYNNYRYMNDALSELPLQLKHEEIKWLHKKNKRRFLVNISKYFFRTRDFKKTSQAIRLAGFRFKDALTGIFQF